MDPAWGTTLSDEETARALCAFQYTQPRSENREIPQFAPANGMSEFGHLANGTHHAVPMTIGRNEAASLLVEMHAPSTSSGDWHRQQQVAIQEQLEQEKRELEMQTKQQQQRNMHLQLQQLQAQLHAQTQTQQIQVQQQVERIQHSRYLSAAGGFMQAASETTSRFQAGCSDRNSFEAQQMQQSGPYYDGRFRRQQWLNRQTAAPPSLKSDYRGRLQAGRPVSRSEAMFDPQPVPPPRNLDRAPTTAPHQWGSRGPMPLSGGQTNTSSVFQRWTTQRFLPQHPQPYPSVEITECSRQEAGTLRNSSRQRPDETFLNGIMKHFPTSAGAPASSAMVSYGSSAGYAAPHNVKSMFDSIAAQGRLQTPTQMHGQVETHSRPAVPPTGAAVVPGAALVSQSARILTMRDILNGDDMPSRVHLPRYRQRGGKQKRAPPKRKTMRKETAAKRQRTEQSEQKSPRRNVGGVQLNQGPSPVPGAVAGSAVKVPTPMYRAFMESRAARVQDQSESNTEKIPAPTSVSPPPESRRATPAIQPVVPSAPVAPRVENRTVVIFCKRDFMRYQAAKIWRKYQEQLKKHEEWREVRVAGKRTRYLNSRYDDEIQRTHKKTGKPRRKAPQDPIYSPEVEQKTPPLSENGTARTGEGRA